MSTEQVPVSGCVHRFLAQAVGAPFDIPPFSKSAMDGFAVRSADLSDPDRVFSVEELIGAGQTPSRALKPGSAVQIMTGAPLPEGADSVVRVEFARVTDGSVQFLEREPSSNIIHQGENARRGDLLLQPKRLGVHDIGVAASVGLDSLTVYRKPRLGILSTGDEIVEPGQVAVAGTIYNSNAYQLIAHATTAGFEPQYFGVARDNEDSLRTHLHRAFADSDVVVLSGGVSKGSFDYVPGILKELGVRTVFHRVAVKPGRPTFFGIREAGSTRQQVFGLPGNPVSSFVMFELCAVRLLHRMCGIDPPGASIFVTLDEKVEKKDPERTEFIPVALSRGTARPVRYGGSSHLNALSTADALLEIPAGTTCLEQGETIGVRPI